MRNTPEIRFEGFESEWEKNKLGDKYSINMGQSPKGKNYTIDSNYPILVQGNSDIENGWVKPRVYTKEITKTASRGDILISVRAPVGDVARTQYNIVIGRGMASIQANDFIYYYFNYLKSQSYWVQYSTGSTFDSISSSQLKELEVEEPNLREQHKIGELFSKFDSLINLKDKEIEKLEAYKNSMMEVMFPKTDEKEPRVRFKSFYKPWKTKKLSDISYVQSSNYKTTDVSNKGVPLYDVSRIIGYVDVTPILEDYITIVKDGSVGKISLRPKGSQYIGTMNAIFSDNCDIKFLYYLMQKIDFDKYTVGSVVPHIYYKNYSKEKLLVPSLEEQKLIGSFFYNLDKHIELKKDELEKLKEFKAALLDKMFVQVSV